MIDPKLVAELEDDTIALADWLDRERIEGLLDITDEIAAHQKRLADLLAQYARTKDPRLLDEIDREMRALDRAYAELDKHQRGMPEDVLDQYVNRDAIQAQQGARAWPRSQRSSTRARPRRRRPSSSRASSSSSARRRRSRARSSQLRGDKFSDEQKKLDEVMNELADVAKDQDDIAAEANKIFESYAQKADEVARDHRREASKKVSALVDKLRQRIDAINEQRPHAVREGRARYRRAPARRCRARWSATATSPRRSAWRARPRQSLDTIDGELEAAISDDPKSKWADATAGRTRRRREGAAGGEGPDRRAPGALAAAGSDHERRRSAARSIGCAGASR